jgi:hypothetical protein
LQNIEEVFSNAYEIELPEGIGISPIFNVADLYPYKESETESQDEPVNEEIQTLNWEEQLPKKQRGKLKQS